MNWKKIMIFIAIAFIILQLSDRLFITKNKGMFKYDGSLSSTERIKRWIEWVTPLAKKYGAKYGIPWQAMAVQSGYENAWGKSSLLREAYNFAGIKAVRDQPYVTKTTHEEVNGQRIEKKAKFRKWNSVDDGFEGYAKFFHDNKRYATALTYPNDPYKFISEIHKAGYATSSRYTNTMHGLLDKYFPNLKLV